MLVHTAILGLGLISASLASASDVDAMHPGLNGFRPGVGNELDPRYEPYVQLRDREAEKNLPSSRWGRYEDRDPGLGATDCKTAISEDKESPVNFGYMACNEGGIPYEQPAGRWGFGSD